MFKSIAEKSTAASASPSCIAPTLNPMPTMLLSKAKYRQVSAKNWEVMIEKRSEWFVHHGFEIPVRQPTDGEINQISPGNNGCQNVLRIDDEATGQQFWVTPELMIKTKRKYLDIYDNTGLVLAITADGSLFIWPQDDSRLIYDIMDSENRWVRAVLDASSKIQLNYLPQKGLREPIWPRLRSGGIEDVAYQSRMIDTVNHPVHERARLKRLASNSATIAVS